MVGLNVSVVAAVGGALHLLSGGRPYCRFVRVGLNASGTKAPAALAAPALFTAPSPSGLGQTACLEAAFRSTPLPSSLPRHRLRLPPCRPFAAGSRRGFSLQIHVQLPNLCAASGRLSALRSYI